MINAVDQRNKVKSPGRLRLRGRKVFVIPFISLSTLCVYLFVLSNLNPVYGADYPPIPALALPAAPTGPISTNEISKAVAADPKAAETAKEATALTNLLSQALAQTNSNVQGAPTVSVAKVAAAVGLVTKAAEEAKANAEKAVEVATKSIEVAKEKAAVAEAVTAKAQEAVAQATKATEVALVATQQAQVATQQAQVATQQAQVATQQAQVSARAADNAVSEYQDALAAGRLMANPIAGESATAGQQLDESEINEKFSIRGYSGVITGEASIRIKAGPVADRLKLIADAAVKKANADKAAADKAEDEAKAAQAKADAAKAAADKAAADAKAATAAADKAKADADALKTQADKANADAAAAQATAAQAATLANAKTLAAQAAAQLAADAKKKLAAYKSKFSAGGSASSPQSERPGKSPAAGEIESPKPNEQSPSTGSKSSQNTATAVFLIVIVSLLVGLASIRMYRKRTQKRSEKQNSFLSLNESIPESDLTLQNLSFGKEFTRKTAVKKVDSKKSPVARSTVVAKTAKAKKATSTKKKVVAKRATAKKTAKKSAAKPRTK